MATIVHSRRVGGQNLVKYDTAAQQSKSRLELLHYLRLTESVSARLLKPIYRISANSFRGNYSFFNLALWSQIRKQKSRETKVTSGQRKATELISLKTNAGVFFFVFVSDFPALSHQKFKVVWKQMNGPVVTYWIFTVFPTKSLISRLRMTSCKQSLQTSFQWDWTL